MSAHIGLIVTGKCEQKGLCDSLARVFPKAKARFHLIDRVESFTSADVRELPDTPGTTLDKFAESLVAAVEG